MLKNLLSLLVVPAMVLSLNANAKGDGEETTLKETSKIEKVTVLEDGKKKEVEVEVKSAKLRVRGDKDAEYKDLNYDELEVDTSGSNDVTLTGRVRHLILDVSGSSHVDTKGLDAETVVIDLSGSGRIKAKASKSFSVDASGSGEIYLSGGGKLKRYRKSGSVDLYQE